MKTSRVWAVCLLACLLTACQHKELCYDHSHVGSLQVVFDWRYAPDACPASMRLYLFPETEGEPLLYEFDNCTGGNIDVPAGHYRALCLNSDTEFILFRNIRHYESFEIYLTDGSFPRVVPRAAVRAIRSVPDKLWYDRVEGVGVLANCEGQTLTFYPQIAVRHYTVEIKNATNLNYLASGEVFGSLTDMSGGFLPGTGRPADELVTLPFDMTLEDETTVTADFYTFGCPPASTVPHKLIVYAMLNDGSKYSFTYDVTSAIHEAPDPMNVHIELDGFPLPKPIDNGSGFNLGIDDWEAIEEIEISM